MRYCPLFIGFFIICFLADAQLPPVLNVTRYNESNGISTGKVTAMLQGKKGYLWFGTTNGLLCYDGYTFRQYNDAAILNTITILAEDSSHCIWMSFLGGGLARFNPATGLFSNYKVHSAKDASLGNAETEMLFFDTRGQLWMGITQKGLVRADTEKNIFTVYDVVSDTNTFYSPEKRKVYNTVYFISEDKNGLFWVATHDGLYQFNPVTKQMKPVREKTVQNNTKRIDLFNSIISDGDFLWLGAWSGGVCRYNKKTNQWKSYLPDPGNLQSPLHNLVTGLAVKNNNELWVASFDMGLGVYNKTSGQFYFYGNSKTIKDYPGPLWKKLITDKDKNVWGLSEDGLTKIKLADYKFFFTRLATTKKISTIFEVTDMWEDEKLQFTGTSFADGLHVVNKLTGKTTILPVDLLPNEEQAMRVRQILKDSRNNFWVLTRDFIYQYDAEKNKLVKIIQPPPYTANIPSSNLTAIAEDKAGNLWITSKRNGVFLYNTTQKIYVHYSNLQKGNYFINTTHIAAVAVDSRGRVWLGGPFNFLGYADPVSKKIIQFNKGDAALAKLPGTQTTSLFADNKGNIWAGTYNGLCFFDCSGKDPLLQKVFKANDGLRSNLVDNVAQDTDGNIWCITEAAVCMINRNNNLVTSYGAIDGITEVGTGIKIVTAPDNKLRLLTFNGYYDFRGPSTIADKQSAPLVITTMMVNDKNFYFEDIIKKAGRIELSPSQNAFSLEMAAIDFNKPDKQQYRYKLEGFDKNWIDAGNRRFVTYTNLPGGNYTFYYKATTNPSDWNVPEHEIRIYIGTVFYKTTWFLLLVIALFAALGYGLYRFRLRQTRNVHHLQLQATRLEKDKTEIQYQNLINQFNPHFLFNSLTSLNSLIYENKELASEFLEQLSAVYRYLLTHKESQLVTVQEEAGFVKHYISLLKTRFEKGLEVNINIPGQFLQKKIVPVTFQLLIENALKHNIVDKASPLIISITADEKYLQVINNIQKKGFVETSNRKGLESLQTLYKYLSALPLLVEHGQEDFTIKVPLL